MGIARFCPACGSRREAQDRPYCGRCGNRFPDTAASTDPSPNSPQASAPPADPATRSRGSGESNAGPASTSSQLGEQRIGDNRSKRGVQVGASLAVVAAIILVLVVLASRSTSDIATGSTSDVPASSTSETRTGSTSDVPAGYNRVVLQVSGCPDCQVRLLSRDEYRGAVSLVAGEGAIDVPEDFTSLDLLVEDANQETGWGATTEVALLYEGFSPGETVTDEESRGAASAYPCLTVSQRETLVSFEVAWDRNPPSEVGDWTEYSLRAWASPQMAADGLPVETLQGRLATQNPSCGL